MRVHRFDRLILGWILALFALLPSGAEAQLRTVISNEIAVSGREASLSLEFENGEGMDIAFREDEVLVDGDAVGSYARGDALDLAWRSLLGEVIALDDGPLARALVEWTPPDGLSGEPEEIALLLDHSLEAGLSLPEEEEDAPPAQELVSDLPGEQSLITALLSRRDALEGLAEAVEGIELESLAVRVGEDVTVETGEEIDGTLILVDGDLELAGTIRGNVILVGGEARLLEGGRITGDLRISDGRLRSMGGELEGDLLELERASSIALERETLDEIREDLEEEIRRQVRSEMVRDERHSRNVFLSPLRSLGEALAGLMENLVTFLVLSVLGVLTVHFARDRFEVVAATARRAPARSAVVGLAGGFLLIPVWVLGIVALAVSIVGIPVLLAWIPFFPIAAGVAGLLGYLAVAGNVGEWVAEQEYRGLEWIRGSNTFYTVIAGIGALLVPCIASNLVRVLGLDLLQGLLAFVGSAVTFAVLAVGLGAVLLTRGGKIRPLESYYEFEDEFYRADTGGPSDPEPTESEPTPEAEHEAPDHADETEEDHA